MRQVIIMRGVPGSGKSTHAQKLGGTIVSADNWFMKNGSYQFDASQLGQAHGACQRAFTEALQRGVELVVVDNTNIKVRDMKFYVDNAKKFNYDWRIVEVVASNPQNVHGVPAEKVAQMQGQMLLEGTKMPDEWLRRV